MMSKMNLLAKKIKNVVTINRYVLCLIVSGILIVSIIAISSKYKIYELLFIIIPLSFIWIYNANMVLLKATNDKYIELQRITLEDIKKELTSSFKEVKSFDESINNTFWAKIDENNIITLIIEDSKGNFINEKKTKDYIWFAKNFEYQ